MQKSSNIEQEVTFDRILSCINTELKNVTSAFCLDESWKSKNDIKNDFLSIVEDSEVYAPDQGSFGEYCHWSFLKFGFVEETPVKRGSRHVKCWKLNEDGIKLLQPSAALAVRTANEFKTSINEALGSTLTKGKSRSPYNRAKILMRLDYAGESDLPELSELLGLHKNAVVSHCKALSKIGLIDFSTQTPNEKGWAKYEWNKGKKAGNVKPVEGYRNLTGLLSRVAEFMEEHSGGWSSYDISEEIKYKHAPNINTVLSLCLERQGFVKRLSKFNKADQKLSEVKIKEMGEKFVEETLRPVYLASQPNANESSLDDIRYELENYMTHPSLRREHAVCAVNLYERIAPNLRAEPREVRERQIINFLKEGRKRPIEVDQMIGSGGSGNYLRTLLLNDAIERKKEGKAVFYALPKI